MDDNPADILDAQALPPTSARDTDAEVRDEEFDALAELDTFSDEPELDDAARIAKLQRSMADFEAGRFRPAKDVMREIAAEYGFSFEE